MQQLLHLLHCALCPRCVRSKAPHHVQSELQRLVDLGYREIVLTGIHTGLYGYDLKNTNLTELLHLLLAEVDGDYRLRLSSIEPLEVSPQLLDPVKREPRMCRHFHIPAERQQYCLEGHEPAL